MRVGYGIAQRDIIKNLYKLRPPFNITTLTLASAIEALKDEKFVNDCIIKNFEQMKRYEDYATNKNFEYIPSYTNFITMYLGNHSSKNIAQKLLEKGVIVRDMTGYGIEICYVIDNETDWTEGMNQYGIGLVNSALFVKRDEKEFDKSKKVKIKSKAIKQEVKE